MMLVGYCMIVEKKKIIHLSLADIYLTFHSNQDHNEMVPKQKLNHNTVNTSRPDTVIKYFYFTIDIASNFEVPVSQCTQN